MNLRNSLKTLLVLVLGLPILLAVLGWVAGLLSCNGGRGNRHCAGPHQHGGPCDLACVPGRSHRGVGDAIVGAIPRRISAFP